MSLDRMAHDLGEALLIVMRVRVDRLRVRNANVRDRRERCLERAGAGLILVLTAPALALQMRAYNLFCHFVSPIVVEARAVCASRLVAAFFQIPSVPPMTVAGMNGRG